MNGESLDISSRLYRASKLKECGVEEHRTGLVEELKKTTLVLNRFLLFHHSPLCTSVVFMSVPARLSAKYDMSLHKALLWCLVNNIRGKIHIIKSLRCTAISQSLLLTYCT